MSLHKSPVVDPSNIPQVALESMNETHREEVELINQLGYLLAQGETRNADEPAITHKLGEWVDHTRDHFERENGLMLKYGFPAYPVHSGEHQTVLGQIEALQQRWLEHKEVAPLAAFIFEEWPRWFSMHVNSMDAVTAQFVSQQIG